MRNQLKEWTHLMTCDDDSCPNKGSSNTLCGCWAQPRRIGGQSHTRIRGSHGSGRGSFKSGIDNSSSGVHSIDYLWDSAQVNTARCRLSDSCHGWLGINKKREQHVNNNPPTPLAPTGWKRAGPRDCEPRTRQREIESVSAGWRNWQLGQGESVKICTPITNWLWKRLTHFRHCLLDSGPTIVALFVSLFLDYEMCLVICAFLLFGLYFPFFCCFAFRFSPLHHWAPWGPFVRDANSGVASCR